MAKGMRVGKNALVKIAKMFINGADDSIDAATLADNMDMSESAAKELLQEMAEAGDVDRFYPPNPEGKRGRAAAIYRPMSEARAKELEPVIRCREAVAVRLGRSGVDAKVTLARVTLTLADMAKLLDIEAPDVVFDADDEDDDNGL